MNAQSLINKPTGQSNDFLRTSVPGTPLLVNLASLQENGHETLELYLNRKLQSEKHPSSFVLAVADAMLSPRTLKIQSVDGGGLTSFWHSPCCTALCDKRNTPHPCMDEDDASIYCDMFCAGSSSPSSHKQTQDLTSQSLFCISDHRGELASCGILDIVLHRQNRNNQQILVSVALTVGCGSRHQGVLVIQHHKGLTFSLK